MNNQTNTLHVAIPDMAGNMGYATIRVKIRGKMKVISNKPKTEGKKPE